MSHIRFFDGVPTGRRRLKNWVVAGAVVLGALAMSGCSGDSFLGSLLETGGQDDDFENAPRAKAPENPPDQSARRGAARRAKAQGNGESRGQRRRPQSGNQLPEDHPPVNQGAGNDRGGGAAGGGSGGVPIDWEAPDSWRAVEPSTDMRKAEFRMPGPEGADPVSMGVFVLKSDGGGVQKNLDRWKKQFEPADRSADITTRSVNGLTVHVADISGTFAAQRGMGSGRKSPNQRMLGAIVEMSNRAVFLKMVGPRETVGAHAEEFNRFVESFRPDT